MNKIFTAWPAEWPRSLNYPEQPVFTFLDAIPVSAAGKVLKRELREML